MSGRAELRFDLVTDDAGRRALSEAWAALWSRTPGARWREHPAWCDGAWSFTQSASGRALNIVSAWRGDALVAVLPLLARSRLGIKIMTPLGSGGTDYSLALIAPEEDFAKLANGLLDHACRKALAAIVRLPFTPAATAFGRVVMGRGDALVGTDYATSMVRWEGVENWESFLSSTASSATLRNNNRLRRRLAERGDVWTGEVLDASERRRTFDWLIERKLDWLGRTGKQSNVLTDDAYVAFFQAQIDAERRTDGTGMRLFRTTCGEEIVAAQVVAGGVGVFELMIITHAREFEKFSVGRLLTEEVLETAFREGAPIDLRLGDDGWKAQWCNDPSTLYDVEVAPGLAGKVLPLYRGAYRLARRMRPG